MSRRNPAQAPATVLRASASPVLRRLAAGAPPAGRRVIASGPLAPSPGSGPMLRRLSPALVEILARMVEAKLAADASQAGEMDGMVGRRPPGPSG